MNSRCLATRFGKLCDERAQVLPLLALMMVGLLSVGALVIDLGNLYVAYRELQSSSDAAALAAAQGLPSGATALSNAASYSSLSGGLNARPNLRNAQWASSAYPKLECLTALTNQGIACVDTGLGSTANAVQVKQQASVPTYLARVFGVSSMTITATATAAMRGAVSSPYNVAIIVDTTASMKDKDSDSQCNSSRLSCALAGVQTLLSDLAPCASSESSCGSANSSGNVSNSVDRVSLFTFPNVTQSTASDDYNCSGSNPTTQPYTFPTAGASSYSPGSGVATYQIVNFASNYRSSDTATTLTGSSNLVESVGGSSGCSGMQAPGGEGTYYAGAIYAAQAALLAEQAANPGSQNVLILLSDGDATSTKSQMGTSATGSGSYPSYVNECHQAITAAAAAAAAGTRVYAVAYGAESAGCTTDTPAITPCQTMQHIASAAQYFYSDYTQSGSGSTCISAAEPTSNLKQIFADIAGDLTLARLIPDNTQ